MTTDDAHPAPTPPPGALPRPELASGTPRPSSDTRPRDTAAEAALLDPERQFLGCLLQLPTRAARTLLVGINPDDLRTPMSRFVLELINDVVAADTVPTPGLILGHAVTTGRAEGEQRRAALGHELITLYQTAPLPLTGKHYKALVLEAAWRRAARNYAIRLQQATESSAVDMVAALYVDRTAVDSVFARYRAADEPDTWTASLSALRPSSRPAA